MIFVTRKYRTVARIPTGQEALALTTRFMRAACGVETGIRNNQSLYWSSANNVRFDNFIDIGFPHAAVPDRIWIDDYSRSVLALFETARLVGPDHVPADSMLRQLLLEHLLKNRFPGRIAGATRMSGVALIRAHEDVLLKLGHEFRLQQRLRAWRSRGPRRQDAAIE